MSIWTPTSASYVCVVVNYTGTTQIYTYSHTLSLHDALPILRFPVEVEFIDDAWCNRLVMLAQVEQKTVWGGREDMNDGIGVIRLRDRKSTRLNSSHYCAPRMPSSA